MKTRLHVTLFGIIGFIGMNACAQGTINFQNLDFENGTFIPIPGDPYGRVEFTAAMPGWTGYVGTNQINWILHNNLFLDTAGIAIQGPNNPSADFLHLQYYLVLQAGFQFPNGSGGIVSSAIAQTGTIPPASASLRFLNRSQFIPGIALTFGAQPIALTQLGTDGNGRWIWGGDISAFAGQTAELRFEGAGYLDYIQFSSQPVPEPSALSLLGLGALVGWRCYRSKGEPAG